MQRFMLALVLASGCSSAVADIEDLASSTGSVEDSAALGDTDDPVSGVVWVDAEGTVVEEVVELPEGMAFEDERGFFWALDPAGVGTDAFVLFPDAGFVDVRYVNANCTEQAVLGDILPPRYAMRGAAGGRSFIAQDDAITEEYLYVYDRVDGDCRELLSPTLGLSFDDVEEVQIPDVYWVAPLHPETL